MGEEKETRESLEASVERPEKLALVRNKDKVILVVKVDEQNWSTFD